MGHASSITHNWAGELEVRAAALRAGVWLGWFSVAAVLIALALGLHAEHRWIVAALMLAAGIANGFMLAVPGRWWTAQRRGGSLLAAWSAGLLALTVTVMLLAGARADLGLLLFLIVPFLATVHSGTHRLAWLTLAIGGVTAVTAASGAFAASEVALRAVLLAGAAMLAVALADLNRRAAAARIELHERAELERLLLAEAHHRVKNSLQTVADLLLLGRPAEAGGRAFDETAARIRAIASVHRLLAEQRGADVSATELLELVAHGLAPDAEVVAVDERLEATIAQHVGMIANELIANAVEHGRAPIQVSLRQEHGLVLTVLDHGAGPNGAGQGLGLQLVQRIVGQGLHGAFALRRTEQGHTEARIDFDPAA